MSLSRFLVAFLSLSSRVLTGPRDEQVLAAPPIRFRGPPSGTPFFSPSLPPSFDLLTSKFKRKEERKQTRISRFPALFQATITMLRSLRNPALKAARIYTPLSVRLASTQAPAVSKVYDSASEAVKDIKSGSIVLSSGFGLCGTPDTLIKAISENSNIQNLTCVSNNAGVGQKGLGE